MSKKADLNLSIQAIVIIILAITLLGIGLTFMRTFIGRGAESLGGILEGVQLENPATANTPITVKPNVNIQIGKKSTDLEIPATSNTPITIKPTVPVQIGKKSTEVLIGFYCNAATPCHEAKPKITRCEPPLAGTAYKDPTFADAFLTPKVDVNPHEGIGFRAILDNEKFKDSSDTFIPGTHICSISIDSDAPPSQDWVQKKQFFVEVG